MSEAIELKNIFTVFIDKLQRLKTLGPLRTSNEHDKLEELCNKLELIKTLEDNILADTMSNLARNTDTYTIEMNDSIKAILNPQLDILSCIGVSYLNAIMQHKPCPYQKGKACSGGQHQNSACAQFKPFSHFLTATEITKPGMPNLPIRHANCFATQPVEKTLRKGDKIYRVVGKNESAFGNWWTSDKPKDRENWRSDYAVLKYWNKGFDVWELKLPDDIDVWSGQTASQHVFDECDGTHHGCILKGGKNQYWIDDRSMNNILLSALTTKTKSSTL